MGQFQKRSNQFRRSSKYKVSTRKLRTMFWISASMISIFFLDAVLGHGMMLNPPSRSSLWRTNPNAERNYDDNAIFCGGFQVSTPFTILYFCFQAAAL